MNKIFWKTALAFFDYRTKIRWLKREPIIDVAFITNFRDKNDQKQFMNNYSMKNGFEVGPRIILDNNIGRVIGIDLLSEDLLRSDGRRKGMKYFIAATEWAREKGARVVLLAAGTKRLFGRNGKQLKELFPDILFTIGDNGTAYLLIQEIVRAFKLAKLNFSDARIAVVGASGILGQQVLTFLLKQNAQVIAVTSVSSLKNFEVHTNQVKLLNNFEDLQNMDVVIACTHKTNFKLSANLVDQIRPAGQKLLVIDVAEPANLSIEEYNKCKGKVIRLDAGNGYSPDFKYILEPLFTKFLHLSPGTTFGCFAEAISLAAAIHRGLNVVENDWFQVNEKNMRIIAELFRQESFGLPAPKCFGETVSSFMPGY